MAAHIDGSNGAETKLQDNADHNNDIDHGDDPNHWRNRVNNGFTKRRQKPAVARARAAATEARLQAPMAVKLPRLPTSGMRAAIQEDAIQLQQRLRANRMRVGTSFPLHASEYDTDQPRFMSMTHMGERIIPIGNHLAPAAGGALLPGASSTAPITTSVNERSRMAATTGSVDILTLGDAKDNTAAAQQRRARSAGTKRGKVAFGPDGTTPAAGASRGVTDAKESPSRRPSSLRLARMKLGMGGTSRSATNDIVGSGPAKPSVEYSITPPSFDELYQVEKTITDKLPLELFDADEKDMSPEAWVALGQSAKYEGKGTPARSPYYIAREWKWTPCRVLAYDGEAEEFTIEFAPPATPSVTRKQVKRLSIRFDDEDDKLFEARLSACQVMKDEAMAQKRYQLFVDGQPATLFSPIEQRFLHGIVGKLMLNAEPLVMAHQKVVEGLLIEVRDEYSRAMKKAIIDYKRQDDTEETRMAHLNLPPVVPVPVVPHLAVVTTPPVRHISLKQARKQVGDSHFTHHPEATQVILALFKSWNNVKGGRFLDVDDSKMPLPMPLFDYSEHQDTHFKALHEKLVNEWRLLVINLIRDNLNNVFKLFINDRDEYEGSELRRFLQMVCFILRHQLAQLAEDSMASYLQSFLKYVDPARRLKAERDFRDLREKLKDTAPNAKTPAEKKSGRRTTLPMEVDDKGRLRVPGSSPLLSAGGNDSKRLSSVNDTSDGDDSDASLPPGRRQQVYHADDKPRTEAEMDADADQDVEADAQQRADLEAKAAGQSAIDLLASYLATPSSHEKKDASQQGVAPLFVFKMTTHQGKVVFTPGLEQMEQVVLGLANIPAKLKTITAIDIEVVPLLGIHEMPLCAKDTVPRIFAIADRVRRQLRAVIQENLREPRALAALYQQYGELLAIDTEQHVREWFARIPDEDPAVTAAKEKAKAEEERKAKEALEMDDDGGSRKNVSFWNASAIPGEVKEEKKELPKLRPIPRYRHTLAETKREIEKFTKAVAEIQDKSPSEVTFRMIKVECKLVKEQLITKAKEVSTRLMEGLATQVREQNTEIMQCFEEMLARIKMKSLNVNDLADLKARARAIEKEEIARLGIEIKQVQNKLTVLEEFGHSITRKDFTLSWTVMKYPQIVMEQLDEAKIQIEKDNTKFLKELHDEQDIFQAELEDCQQDVRRCESYGWSDERGVMEAYPQKVEVLHDKLDKAEKAVESFNKRETLFGGTPAEYTELVELRKKFRPYYQLWTTYAAFTGSQVAWTMGLFVDLDPVQISNDVTGWHKMMYRLERDLSAPEARGPQEVATRLRVEIGKFKEHVPIISWLRSPGLRPRHWDKISMILAPGKPTLSDHEITLQQLLNMDVAKHKGEIEDICQAAAKEYSLELTLDKMRKEWKNVELQLEPYNKTYFVRGSEDIRTLLDDQILKTQAMRGSPYIQPWARRTRNWEKRLTVLSEVLDEWMTCQKTWLYLEPIFGAEDIIKQMPVESRRFGVVDAYWRKTMEAAKKMPNILEFVSVTDGLHKNLQELNKMLDLIQKALNEYLDLKRSMFPRFYFLDNDGLLSILSQTKNVLAVQPHLPRCFDGINALEFTSDRQIIAGIHSSEGEYVPYVETIDPNTGPRKGNVEVWLKDVERVMRTTLQRAAGRALVSYGDMEKKKQRDKWIKSQPGQIALAISQLMWTKQVTEAIRGGRAALQEFHKKCVAQIDALVEMVRGDLSTIERLTVGAMIVLDVHARDVVQRLLDEDCKAPSDFEWLAQMRYYWEQPERKSTYVAPVTKTPAKAKSIAAAQAAAAAAASATSTPRKPAAGSAEETKAELELRALLGQVAEADFAENGVLRVRMINTCMDYQYEYLGNSTRLVITPLTDRCYRTLMGAVHLHMGGAPEGPAGTGKTETVKDLSKAVAIQCVIFNGSDSLTFRRMAQFFKGLASGGGWACFDEFNRIELEVLSVIAQQIYSIQRAINENKHTFFFVDTNIPLVHTCTVFITMNPGYAGRAELPDNLKALFRSVAMMIPDYAMIAEIVLFSYGYSAARQLARKIVACLRLSSEQLSAQEHYDFGMRNLTAILGAAGRLKRSFPRDREENLCLRAISDCNVPKFISADLPLFDGITRDLFPDLQLKDQGHEVLTAATITALKSEQLQPVPAFVTKCIELYDTVMVRHGLMLVGPSWSAKSTSIRVLANAITASAGREEFQPVNVHYINPKAVELAELYGSEDPNTHEWRDGILPPIMRECVADTSANWKWVVFDGPVDAVWIESMNTVLDDTKKLCLASGEQIKIKKHMHLIFEVEDLQHASPATVSRCGMVYMEPKALGWEPIIDTWLARLPADLDDYKQTLSDLIYWLAPPALEFVSRHTKDVIPTTAHARIRSMCHLLGALLDEYRMTREARERDRPPPPMIVIAPELDEYGEEIKKPSQPSQAELRKRAAAAAAAANDDDINTPRRVKGDSKRAGGPSGAAATATTPTPADEKLAPEPKLEGDELIAFNNKLENLVMFAIVWSIGAQADADGQAAFSSFFRSLIKGSLTADEQKRLQTPVRDTYASRVASSPFPDGTTESPSMIYDYTFNRATSKWDHWMTLPQAAYTIPEKAQFHDIIVPTISTVRMAWLLEQLITHDQHVLISGSTGTGKSVMVQRKLLTDLATSKYGPLMMSFSARTSAAQAQDFVDNKLERRKQGVLGPPLGKRCVVFVDDLNMPAREKYGAQPPIELLRQWMDYKGWYDRKALTFRTIEDVQYVAAMGPPGGGRNVVTDRYLRHFQSLCVNPYDEHSLKLIFGTIVTWWMGDLNAKIRGLALKQPLVDATVRLYHSISATPELKPTPSKSHYTFNLRDISKVFQGIMAATDDTLQVRNDVVRLWAHECTRVFCDRLINDDDQKTFHKLLADEMKNHFGVSYEEALEVKAGEHKRLIYCDFINPRSAKKPYIEIKDIEALTTAAEGYLKDFNMVEKNPMNLVLFTAAIEHVARISRIIRAPLGNALLVGVGGSGRESLAKLAAFIADYDLFQIELVKHYGVNEWREDLRDVCRKAGIHNKPMVFLFKEAHIKHESFIEDINNLLNNGEVPNLFPVEEHVPGIIIPMLVDANKAGKGGTNASTLNFFFERCKQNIHVVLCLSPVGDAFRTRLRQYPSLVNCTTIDWFHAWPTDALQSVAQRFLKDVDLPPAVKQGVVEVCVDMQERAIAMSAEYKAAMRRANYVTPTSYLELIRVFQKLFEVKRREIDHSRARYENGLKKLNDTAQQVESMKAQLAIYKPQLVESSKATQALMKDIEQQSKTVKLGRARVAQEEAECNQQREEASKIQQQCEEELSEVMPALNMAVKALRVLKKSALDELRSLKVPTPGVVMTIEALCIMMGVQPRKVGPVGAKKLDYFEPARRKLLKDVKLMDKLENYPKDNIPVEIMTKVRPYLKNPDFIPSKIAMASKAAEGFCKWVLAMEVYDRVTKQAQPKRERLEMAQKSLALASAQLASKKEQLREVQDLLDKLNADFDAVNKKKLSLEQQVNECSERLERADKLMVNLRGEKDRWLDKSTQLNADYANVLGNILVASGVVAYLGAFTSTYRDRCITEWIRLLAEKKIACGSDFQLHKVLADPLKLRQWGIQMLPKDGFSLDNAVILHTSLKWSLMIDPQEQASRWIKNMEAEERPGLLRVLKASDETLSRVLAAAIPAGHSVLIENVGEALDPMLDPVLLKQVSRQAGRDLVKLGADQIEWNPDFRLYLTTRMHNPHYTPETSTKVTLLNFMVTPEGLEDQMLGLVVSQEDPITEKDRHVLIGKDAANKRDLQLLEDQILEHLFHGTGNILDDEQLIQTLQRSKHASKLIERRVEQAKRAEEVINTKRGEYKAVAFNASNLFFCIADLSAVDPMYQYSLRWFTNLFLKAIKEAEHAPGDTHVRTQNIDRAFLRILYVNVCRSLFEKDKLLFSFLLYTRLLLAREQLDQAELRFLLTGGTGPIGDAAIKPNPTDIDTATTATTTAAPAVDRQASKESKDGKDVTPTTSPATGTGAAATSSDGKQKWLTDAQWQAILQLSKLEKFAALEKHFVTQQRVWRAYYNDPTKLPPVWERSLTPFQKLLVLRVFRPDKLIGAIQRVVSEEKSMGKQFINPPSFELSAAFADSDNTTPLIFVLSPGVDPVKEVIKLAQQMGFSSPDKLASISLGQGQGPFAENAIREAIDKGTWVLLQNCHLAVSWLPTLQKIVDDINPKRTHQEFRLWLTSMPSPHFPVSILQNGVKMTNEPPRGIKQNLLQSYSKAMQDDHSWDEPAGVAGRVPERTEHYRKLLFGLCFFHAIVLERRKFGAIGWNISYEFNDSDLAISKKQLKMFVDMYQDVPFTALKYLVGQLNYGGRVTDDWDRRCITHILEDYFTERMLDDDYKLDERGIYHAPPAHADLEEYRKLIRALPATEDADVFGLHDNVNVSTAIKEAGVMFDTMLMMQPRSNAASAGGRSRDTVLKQLVDEIEGKLAAFPNFNLEAARAKYPVVYSESINTVLVQELVRFNRLLTTIHRSLHDLQRAIDGWVVMSADLEKMANDMFDGRVPEMWEKVSYPSLKPLGSWVADLLRRLKMFNDWVVNGAPGVFWISGFFFTQSFLTGILQNYARREHIAIDEISFDFKVMPNISADHKTGPDHGCYIHGLFLEGARWDASIDGGLGALVEPEKRQLHTELPVLWLQPCETKRQPRDQPHYRCPVYKTSKRAGTLSTTGHSTNFVLAVNLRAREPERFWVKRGVALLCQLDA